MGKNGAITWTTEKRKLKDLKPWPINPRLIKKDQAARLTDSLEEYGQVDAIAIEPDNEVVNGHQRLSVWQYEHGEDFEVDVRVSSRKLSDEEKKRLTVYLHQGTTGEWDFDLLADNFEKEDLLDWGFSEKDLGLLGDGEGKVDQGEAEEVISPELFERHDYLVFYFDNEFDWNVACEFFHIQKVQGAPVSSKSIVQHGLGRLLKAAPLLELIKYGEH